MPNSFRIYEHGPRAQVLAAVAAAVAEPEGSEQSQVNALKPAVLALLKALPEKFNGLHVLATGQLEPTGGDCRIEFSGYDLPAKTAAEKTASTKK